MPLDPYLISGHVRELIPGTVTPPVYDDAKICAYNVTKGGYISTTSNNLGEYQLDLSNQTVETNEDGYATGDKIQLYIIDSTNNMSMCYRHTIAAGDGGAWSQDVYLHVGKLVTFRMGGDSGTTPLLIGKCYVKNVTISNITPASRMIYLFDRTNDILKRPIECPADDSITVDLGNMLFDGGVCVTYEIDTNNSSGYNDLECTLGYGNNRM